MKIINRDTFFRVIIIVNVFLFPSCKKFIEVDSPKNRATEDDVYKYDQTAIAVLTDIYATMSDKNEGLQGNGFTSISLFAGLSGDELTLFDFNNLDLSVYYQNVLTSQSLTFWNEIYPNIFICNSALEGLNKSNSLSSIVRQQLLGEAKFMRAFCYFYLVNMYGDVPLVLSTNYKINAVLPRTPKEEVYKQIIEDLKDAQKLLNEKYVDGNILSNSTDRVRPNSFAATSLLARVYLYTNKWADAEEQASKVINQTSLYDTVSLNEVFLKNSKETIWALQPVGVSSNATANTGEGKIFVLPSSIGPGSGYPVYLSNYVIDAFESGDLRKEYWTDTVQVRDGNGNLLNIYPFVNKYKVGNTNTETKEFPIILRLSEQYLIRSEARAEQNKLSDAVSDLNIIRKRSRLNNINVTDNAQLLMAIIHERQVELFTEWGHRWFDLKRREIIDEVMDSVSIAKGEIWDAYKSLYPIPLNEIIKNPALSGHQNPGYN
jgi:starch-binding outer membrane protein, SusD/RagB family